MIQKIIGRCFAWIELFTAESTMFGWRLYLETHPHSNLTQINASPERRIWISLHNDIFPGNSFGYDESENGKTDIQTRYDQYFDSNPQQKSKKSAKRGIKSNPGHTLPFFTIFRMNITENVFSFPLNRIPIRTHGSQGFVLSFVAKLQHSTIWKNTNSFEIRERIRWSGYRNRIRTQTTNMNECDCSMDLDLNELCRIHFNLIVCKQNWMVKKIQFRPELVLFIGIICSTISCVLITFRS